MMVMAQSANCTQNAALTLNAVHAQRIAVAVEAARSGRAVEFRVEDGDTCHITWYETFLMRPRRRVIACGSLCQMRATLERVQAEFQRQLQAAISDKECGAVGV